MHNPVMRVGLVLGAGGLSGEAFHRGVLRGLMDGAGWDARTAEVIVGTSAGSLVGAALRAPAQRSSQAHRPRVQEAVPLLPGRAALLAALRRPWKARPGALLPAGRIPTDFIEEGVRRRYGSAWAERDLHLVAVRRRDSQRVVFGAPGHPRPEMACAVAASCAIPAYFRPVVCDGVAYIDGGVHSPTNADLLATSELDLVIVSSPMTIARAAVRPRLDLSLRLMWRRTLGTEVRLLRRAGMPVLCVEPDTATLARYSMNAVNARNLDEVEERAYAMTVERLRAPSATPFRALLAPHLSDSA